MREGFGNRDGFGGFIDARVQERVVGGDAQANHVEHTTDQGDGEVPAVIIVIGNLPDKVGVTAYLNINYKAPTRADQFIVLKIHLDEAQGRKAKVTGTVEDMNGKVLVEAKYVFLHSSFFFMPLIMWLSAYSALFVQPRYAKLLNSTAVRHMLGEPSKKDHSTEGVPVPVTLPGGAQTLVDGESAS